MPEILDFEESLAPLLKELDVLTSQPRTDSAQREIDAVQRRLTQLQIEEEALKKERDQASKLRLQQVAREVAGVLREDGRLKEVPVRLKDGTGDLLHQLGQDCWVFFRVFRQARGQRAAVQILHGEERFAAVLAVFVQLDDVGMFQLTLIASSILLFHVRQKKP